MGKKRDVIVSALACGGKMSCRKQAAEFDEPPQVININSSIGVPTEGGTVQGFRKTASALRIDNSILKTLFWNQKVEPRRVALVSYLDGWSFINEVIKTDDFQHIDTIIVLEGLNTRSAPLLQQWEDWVAQNQLVLAYTQAPHKTAASKSACSKLVSCFVNERALELPEYLGNVQFEKSVSIYSKTENPKTKIFHEDTLVNSWYSDGILALEYKGKQSQDQTYIQQYVQPRIWHWLAERWKDSTNGRAWSV